MLDVANGEAVPLVGFDCADEPIRFDETGNAIFNANLKDRYQRIDRL